MPIFEYRCSQCGHVTSFLEKAGTGGPHPCEACNSARTEKLLSVFAANVAGGTTAGSAASCPTGTCPFAR